MKSITQVIVEKKNLIKYQKPHEINKICCIFFKP